MATESGGFGSLRLTAPVAQAYDQSPGELQLLHRITPENLGGMLGFLQGQQAQGRVATDQYRSDLRGVNAQQYQLGQAKLQADELQNLRGTAISAMQHGGVDVGNLLPLLPLLASRDAVNQTDALRRQASRAGAIKDMGAGMNSLSEAGVNLNPGQSVSLDPAQLGQLRSTTGLTRDERVAGIGANATMSAARSRAAGDDGVQVESVVGNVPGEDRDTFKGKNQEEVLRRAQERRQQRGRGGLTGPAAGAGGTGTAAPSASGVRTAEQASTRIRELGLPSGTRPVERGGVFYARTPDGKDQPLR